MRNSKGFNLAPLIITLCGMIAAWAAIRLVMGYYEASEAEEVIASVILESHTYDTDAQLRASIFTALEKSSDIGFTPQDLVIFRTEDKKIVLVVASYVYEIRAFNMPNFGFDKTYPLRVQEVLRPR